MSWLVGGVDRVALSLVLSISRVESRPTEPGFSWHRVAWTRAGYCSEGFRRMSPLTVTSTLGDVLPIFRWTNR